MLWKLVRTGYECAKELEGFQTACTVMDIRQQMLENNEFILIRPDFPRKLSKLGCLNNDAT